ncbi:protein GUCD1-like [Haliotis asinina]|uniref:protein GUCD1-like n=1 Tax=Haliotis asinina TaxID=109174 RepID=UPI003531DE17
MAEIRLGNKHGGGDESDSNIRRITVPHVQQCFHWDCGLACVSMVLKYFDIPSDQVYTSDLDSLQCGESVWTIDLAYLLKRYAIPHRYFTTTLGVDKNYSKQAYYCRNYDKESVRVNKAFDDAKANGIDVEQKTLGIEDIVRHLKTDNLVISLVNWTQMECIWCDSVRKGCLCCLDLCAGYQGHYIVLCGYNTDKGHIYYRNPDQGGPDICCSRFSQYDKARKSFGTDEDLLFTFKKTEVEQEKSGIE